MTGLGHVRKFEICLLFLSTFFKELHVAGEKNIWNCKYHGVTLHISYGILIPQLHKFL